MTTEQKAMGQPPPKHLSARWKFLIIFVAAVIAAVVLDELHGHTGRAPDIYIAEILGTAVGAFAIGSIVAVFIKGTPGAVTGVAIIIWFSYYVNLGYYSNHKAERDVINSINKIVKSLSDITRAQLDQHGFTNIDPATVDAMMNELESKSKGLDPQSASAVEALVAVTKGMVAETEELRTITTEVFAEQFQNPANIKTIQDIDARLQRVRDLRRAWERLIDVYQQLDVRVKAELASKGLPPLKIKEWANNYIYGAHLEISISLVQLRMQNADVMTLQYNLLRSQFGRWRADNKTVYFDDDQAANEWIANSREFFEIAEQSEALQRKRLALHEAEK
jgi:hypothetical protein